METEELLVGANGTFSLNDAATFEGRIAAFVVTSECEITELEIEGQDVLATYVKNPANTLDPGTVLRPIQTPGKGRREWVVFSKITTASGKGTIYRG